MKKFYSYTNENKNYTKACALENVRSVKLDVGEGKSAIRYGVTIRYIDDKFFSFDSLQVKEAKKVYTEILELLNK